MSARVVVAGANQCIGFTQVCLVADHLAKNLPNFCYESITKTVSEWEPWLWKINTKNQWHHQGSPLVWKELLAKGSKAYYIGGASEFWEYCHAYYNLDRFMSEKIFADLENGVQYQRKLKDMKRALSKCEDEIQSHYVISISGASHKSTPQLVSGLMDMSEASSDKKISKIYLYDETQYRVDLMRIEEDCSYVASHFPGRVVRMVNKLGTALAESDLLIVMNHIPFDNEMTVHYWLLENVEEMLLLADSINASAPETMRVIFPNFGPSCFNATILNRSTKYRSSTIAVATSDLGLEALAPTSQITGVPLKDILCPPVWGFVGVNHLVDMRTAHHRYCTFRPYPRCVKVPGTTLKVGSLTPELRTLEYLLHWDRSLWLTVAERKKIGCEIESESAHKMISLLGTIKLWLFECPTDYIANVGVACNGSFGLRMRGVFSQPSRLVDGYWEPATDFPMPRDPNVKLKYLEEIAKKLLEETVLPHELLRKFASSSILLSHSNFALDTYGNK